MVSCCCLHLSSLWEQMVKACKWMGHVLSVTHSPTADPAADSTGKLSTMDINHLEEEYLCNKQKQKLQTHIIVFKTGEDEPLTTEALVTTVPVNKKVQKPKAFEERLPVRVVNLDILHDATSHEPIDPWHIHLDIHRLVQVEHQNLAFNAVEEKHKQGSFDDDRMTLEGNGDTEPMHPHLIDSPTEEKSGPFRSIQRKPSWKPLTTTLIHHQISSINQMSGSNKLYYYPFPQKKGPRISEAARRLGLYVTQSSI